MSESDEPDTGPKVRWLTVSEHHSGQRLDNYLQRELKGVPRTRLYRALRKGEVRVNKGRVKADHRLQEGDQVRIPPIRVAPTAIAGELPRRWQTLLEKNNLFEDKDLLVINKPSGLAVHGGSGLSFGLIEGLRRLRPEEPYLELVHRLDRDTSGCIMIARRAAMLKNLHRQLQEDQIDKRYLALVAGNWPRKRQFVEAPLQKNTLQSGERLVRVERGGKAARTEFAVLERFAGYTLVEAKPITGRTHQIRVHALHAGFPLLGDEKYGDREVNQRLRGLGLKRLFLHAASLTFTNGAGLRQKVEAPLDNELKSFLEKISS